VHIRTPRKIFEDPRWPKGVKREILDPYYDKAKEVLDARPFPSQPTNLLPHRTTTFMTAAQHTGRKAELLDICVHTGNERVNPYSGILQGGCVNCGNCMLGCHVHAKNTLDLTYLAVAEKNGAEVYPLHLAEKIQPIEAAEKNGYNVSFKRFNPTDGKEFEHGEVSGKMIIISAGSLGSTELMLRSRDRLPNLSKMLGRKFSGNGDFILAGAMDTKNQVDPGAGPSITAGVDYSNDKDSIYIEDLGYPDVFLWYLEGVLPSPGKLQNFLAFLKIYVLKTLGLSKATNFTLGLNRLFCGGITPRFLPYLGMGSDAADGEMKLSNECIDIEWNHTRSLKMFRQMEEAMRKLSESTGGRYQTSILWKWPSRKLVTAHPLGGCPMADGIEDGVVNEFGEVWNYPNLYVADGSIIPTALGVNPSATISALSERIADHICN
jgi:cholesterol oxidase